MLTDLLVKALTSNTMIPRAYYVLRLNKQTYRLVAVEVETATVDRFTLHWRASCMLRVSLFTTRL